MYQGLEGFFFRMAATIFSVFLIVDLGLNPFRLVIMGTILEVSYFLLEVPTGVLADTVSRKLSVIVGLAGIGLGFVILGLAPTFLVAGISQVVWGVFATFTSGADVAWMTDEVGEDEARRYYVRGDQWWHVGALIGIASSVALATIDLRLPIVLAGVGYGALSIVMAFLMREERFRPRPRSEGERLHQGMVATFKSGVGAVRAHHVLILILAVAALHGASSEGFDRLSDYHLLNEVGLPSLAGFNQVLWFGVLDGVALLFGLGALTFVKRRTHLVGHAHVARILAVIDVLLVIFVVVFAVTGGFVVALIAFWIVGGLRSVRDPIFVAWVNQGLDPATRATINSMSTQADAVGQAAGGPVLGVIGNRSVPWALGVSGLLGAPALALYARAIRRGSVGTVEPAEAELELDDEP
jgi:DHA3 family tetracycline resistance protein-like MFS transporter